MAAPLMCYIRWLRRQISKSIRDTVPSSSRVVRVYVCHASLLHINCGPLPEYSRLMSVVKKCSFQTLEKLCMVSVWLAERGTAWTREKLFEKALCSLMLTQNRGKRLRRAYLQTEPSCRITWCSRATDRAPPVALQMDAAAHMTFLCLSAAQPLN